MFVFSAAASKQVSRDDRLKVSLEMNAPYFDAEQQTFQFLFFVFYCKIYIYIYIYTTYMFLHRAKRIFRSKFDLILRTQNLMVD